MTNNLKKLEQDLRSLAKRCKNISYTKGLLLSFLMLGLLSFSEGLTSPEIKSAESSINQARKELNTSISDMKTLFREAKRENDKLLKGSNLELIQLMEQGDQVVKSPWSSWQYGMNYFYSNWRGTYKGKGDKKEKYPYEGIYRRSNDLFLRSISPNSRNYSRYVTRVYDDPLHSATTSTTGLSNASWGIESSVFDQEPVTTLNLLATVRPKEIKKQAPVVNLGTIEGPEEISFSINPPEVAPGKPVIKNIGLNQKFFKNLINEYYLTKLDIKNLHKARNVNSHKGNFGKVLIYAGSKEFSGASVLASNSCVRAGAGLVTLLTSENILKNNILSDWIKSRGYYCNYLNKSYSNSNYHRKDKNSISEEVLITNYPVDWRNE